MRRDDRRIQDRREVDEIIAHAEVCRLAMIADGGPYLVPLNFGYDGKSLFFHSAHEGKKIAALKKDNRVWFEIEGPQQTVSGGLTACRWTMEFSSVMGSGRAVLLSGPEEKRRALSFIMAQYVPKTDFVFDSSSLEGVQVFQIVIDFIEGKSSRVPGRSETK